MITGGGVSAPDLRRFNVSLWIVALGILALGAIVCSARSRGIWLDEFWSQRLGDPEIPLGTVITERWLSDTHPPLANLFYRLVSMTGMTSITAQRLLLNLPALFLLTGATLVFARRSPVVVPAMFVGALSLAGSIEAFADFRSYALQVCLITIVFQYSVRLLSDTVRIFPEHILGGAALHLSLLLHYVTSIQLSIFVVGLVVALFATRRRIEAFGVLGIAGLAWTGLLVSGLILIGRMQRDIDFGWIQTSTATAVMLFVFLVATTVLSMPLVALFAIQGARRAVAKPNHIFVGVLIWTIVAGFVCLVLFNVLTPIIIQRYLLAWQLAVVALLAVLAEPLLASGRWRMPAVFAFAALMVLIGAHQTAGTDGWTVNRDRIAAEVKVCPGARVYGLSPWALKTARGSNAAARETQVVLESYLKMAREGSFSVTVLPLGAMHAIKIGDRCPTFVWVEHIDPANIKNPDYILRAAGLRPSASVRASLIASGSGVVLRLDPQNIR